MTITLAQLRALDFDALWASLSPADQARIGVLAIRYEFASQVAQDGGFATTIQDREDADQLATAILNEAPEATWTAFPDLLPIDHDDLYPCWQIIGDNPRADTPKAVTVRGSRRPHRLRWRKGRWCVRVRGEFVRLAGARDVVSRIEGADPVWEWWTVPQVEAERHRLHPEIAAAEAAEDCAAEAERTALAA